MPHAAHHNHAINLATTLDAFLFTHGHWEQAHTLHQTALHAATHTGDRHGQASALDSLSRVQYARGEYGVAEVTSTRALDLYTDLGNRHGQANGHLNLGKLLHGLHDGTLLDRLRLHPWLASPWVQRRHHGATVDLDIVLDCPADAPDAELVRDEPISFDPRERRYGWRSIHRDTVTVSNPAHRAPTPATAADPFDPMAAFEGIA